MKYRNLVIVRIAVVTAFVVGIQFFVLVTAGLNVACAQNELADRIDSIRIEGNQRIESETIISSAEFLESVTYRAQDLGRQSNCEYAEGFISHQIPKATSLLDL